jgi:hypothetical protein
MDRLYEFLDDLKHRGIAQGRCLGLFNVVIGRRITLPDGTVVSPGATWRELASALKRVRWDKDAVRDCGLDPAGLPPRDRQRYWYAAIAQAGVDSPAATAAGNQLAELLTEAGYGVGPPPA